MAANLRFDSHTGQVVARTPNGKYTKELLQLNDDDIVQYRLGALRTIRLYDNEIKAQERQLKILAKQLRAGQISQTQYDAEEQSINSDLNLLRHTLQTITGELPLPTLRKHRLGVSLLTRPQLTVHIRRRTGWDGL